MTNLTQSKILLGPATAAQLCARGVGPATSPVHVRLEADQSPVRGDQRSPALQHRRQDRGPTVDTQHR